MRPDAIPKHRHKFRAYTVEKDEKKGDKFQFVECIVPGCTVRFSREKEFKP